MEEESKVKTRVEIGGARRGSTFVNSVVEIPHFYANNVEIGFSNWDMRMDFGEILGAEDGMSVILRVARVSMSLEHAKAFVEILNKTLANFEKLMGREIQIFEIPPKGEPAGEAEPEQSAEELAS